MGHNKPRAHWESLNSRGLFTALGTALISACLFSVIILFSWNHVMPEMFRLPSMRFKEALGCNWAAFLSGFLLNPRRARIQDRLHREEKECEASSTDRLGGDSI